MNGKGSRRRPEDSKRLDSNWDRIFKKKKRSFSDFIRIPSKSEEAEFAAARAKLLKDLV